jgi:formylglycine-generating enzyme required for sulfatase activity
MRSLVSFAAMAFASASCSGGTRELPPRGQVLLYIDTDAPLPSATTTSDLLGPVPLFDRLRLDVSACEDVERCPPVTQDFPVDEARLRDRKLSIGIVPAAPGDRPLVRARLFLVEDSLDLEPVQDVTIDVTTVLPEIPAEGVIERTLFLPTDLVGQSSSQVDTTEGPPSVSAVGTWPGAQRIDCPAPPGEGEVCVPGGAFWMGNPHLRDFRTWLDPAADARRLVVLSPFYLDAHETTVAEIRAAHTPAIPKTTDDPMQPELAYCTYSAAPSVREALPANCVKRTDARAHCVAKGRDLPTEAQFEYAASSLGRALWPWGNEVPSCADAIVARAIGGIDPGDFTSSTACHGKGSPGPLLAGSGARDRVDLPSGTIFDLVGNLSEFARDLYQFRSDFCWSRRGVYVDPVCEKNGSSRPGFLLKGGNFWWFQGFSFAPVRFPIDSAKNEPAPLFGFRCARKAE